jgi:DNA-binding CsgD family transcriptional regulator
MHAESPITEMLETPEIASSGLPAPLASLIDPLERIRTLECALDSLGQALMVLDAQSRVLYASPNALKILEIRDGLSVTDGVLRACHEEEQAKLTAALRQLLAGATDTGKMELDTCRPSGRRSYKLRMSALPSGQVLAVVHDTHTNHTAWHERLQARFQLTPRECECAMMLTDGLSMAEIADRMNISMQTLRQHLKHAFTKTGTHKQHELVGIVLQMQRKR